MKTSVAAQLAASAVLEREADLSFTMAVERLVDRELARWTWDSEQDDVAGLICARTHRALVTVDVVARTFEADEEALTELAEWDLESGV
jgi:hypothetical protein